jgi:hypothetical protein
LNDYLNDLGGRILEVPVKCLAYYFHLYSHFQGNFLVLEEFLLTGNVCSVKINKVL